MPLPLPSHSHEATTYRIGQCTFGGMEIWHPHRFVEHQTDSGRIGILYAEQNNQEILPNQDGLLQVNLVQLNGACRSLKFDAVLCSKTFVGRQGDVHITAYRFKILREYP